MPKKDKHQHQILISLLITKKETLKIRKYIDWSDTSSNSSPTNTFFLNLKNIMILLMSKVLPVTNVVSILCVSEGNLNEFFDLKIFHCALNLCASNQEFLGHANRFLH